MSADVDRNLRPRRISVVGATGSGKTHLARELAERLKLPHYELDSLRHDPTGADLPNSDFIQSIATLADEDAWIIDGHYRDVREMIWRRADMVVWLNLPLWLVAFRLVRRFGRKRLPPRQGSATSGEKLAGQSKPVATASWGHRLGRLARTLRERREYGRLLRGRYPGLSLVELRSPAATRAWLRVLGGLEPAGNPEDGKDDEGPAR